MHNLFTLPVSLCMFIQSLDAPPGSSPAHHHEAWPEPDAENAPHAGTLSYPPASAWLIARDGYINHIMKCCQCVTHGPKIPRHCPAGDLLRRAYDRATIDWLFNGINRD